MSTQNHGTLRIIRTAVVSQEGKHRVPGSSSAFMEDENSTHIYSPFTKLWQSCSDLHPKIRHIAIFGFYSLKTTSHFKISMHGQYEKGKIQRNNYHPGNCGRTLTAKTSSVFLIFAHRSHRNVKNRLVGSSLKLQSRCTLTKQFFPKVDKEKITAIYC